MTETTDRPDISERYSRAINSSDLRVRERIQGDSDILMAAGWTGTLGTMLHRLSCEFDQVKGDMLKVAGNDQTGALLVFMHLKTLSETRTALHNFALELATKRRFDLDDKAVAAIGTRVLVAWLDPNCHRCGATGRLGGYDGKIQSICRTCQGSGTARQAIGQCEVERVFAGRLMADMDRMREVARGRLTRLLRRR